MSESPMLPFDDAEEWRDVVDWEGLYQVSSLGRVRSLPRRVTRGVRPGRVLKPQVAPSGFGYETVVLSLFPVKKTRTVHSLVLEAFHGPRPEGMEGCHGPGGPRDNRASVLRWDTHAANTGRDKVRDGTLYQGDDHPQALLTGEQVMDMRRRCADGETLTSVGRSYGLPVARVSAVVSGRSWAHLPGAVAIGKLRGEALPQAKLTADLVRAARSRHAAGERQSALAREYGVSVPSMYNILKRHTWKHVA